MSIPVTGEKISDQLVRDNENHFVVGIGASAGGLEAINEIFENMPANSGFSFVVIQHLSPDYKSLMSELLSKRTSINVVEANDNMLLEPDTIYLLPSKMIMKIKNGRLHLKEKIKDNLPNNAIDTFFESLAEEMGSKAVGVILSGTGSDGTKGALAIKEKNGLVIVQDPLTAGFDGMPNSAINSGAADLILAAEMIPDEMIDLLKDVTASQKMKSVTGADEQIVNEILAHLQHLTQFDFTDYKRPTINRRLSKRMLEKNITELKDYYDYLKKNTQEATVLVKEFLIGVTKFFRDEEVFNEIGSNVLPSIFATKKTGTTAKIWVVACSTGEEAYSLAIMIQEYLDRANLQNISFKIFATDIDKEALEVASRGVYPLEIENDISKERLTKFFTKEGTTYRIAPAIRKTVVFASHNVFKDPPFSRIDLISCRNMLIYMNAQLQKSVMRAFHFAVNLNGFIILGPSENPGQLKESLKEISKKWKIYRCITKSRTTEDFYASHTSSVPNITFSAGGLKQKNAIHHLAELFRDSVMEDYRFAGIFIDREFEVKQAIGDFKRFMKFPEGNFNFNLLKLVSPDLSIALGICIRKAIQTNEKATLKKVKVIENSNERFINIIVKPYLEPGEFLQAFLFVVLEEERMDQHPVRKVEPLLENDERINDLERELKETRDNLQAVIEELESTNEELQSSNEEIVSSNEELQSTNEELQSLNEELHTVNAEHQLKIRELIDLNDDMDNYFRNSDIGQVFIDGDMIIRKFTPVVTRQINLIENDIGRNIGDLSNKLSGVDLIASIRKVIDSGKSLETEVTGENNHVYVMRISPYVKTDKSQDGVVVNFIDITELKKLDSIITGIFNGSTNAITAKKAIRDDDNRIVDFEYIAANHSAEEMLGKPVARIMGSRLSEVPELYEMKFGKYKKVVETGEPEQFEIRFPANNKWYEINVVQMMDGLVTTFNDITQRKKAADVISQSFKELKTTSEKLQATNIMLEQSNLDLMQFASVASHDLKEPLRKVQAFGNMLKERITSRIDEKEKLYLDKMVNAANRMQTLVEDVLTLSKLSNKEIPLEETDLNSTLDRIVDDLEITVKEKGANITIKDLPILNAVPGQMHQLFQNLLTNSLKFCTQASPDIEVGQADITREVMDQFGVDEKDYCLLYVKDNGIGFEPQYSETIFGVFQRLNSSGFSGTGIGLAICKKIVENHRGFIWPESSPGKGTTFYVMLPVRMHKLHI